MEKQFEGKLYAVYGTLRKGLGNYKRYLDNDDCKYLGTQKLRIPYKMVSLGGFPGLVWTNPYHSQITIEVFNVTSPDIEKQLDMLEGYPDFYEKTTINTQWGEATIYYLHSERYANYPVVESGDWVNRVKQV